MKSDVKHLIFFVEKTTDEGIKSTLPKAIKSSDFCELFLTKCCDWIEDKIEACENWQACPGEVFHCAPVSSSRAAQTDQLTTAEEKLNIWGGKNIFYLYFVWNRIKHFVCNGIKYFVWNKVFCMKWNKVVKNYLEAFIVCEQCEHCGDIVCYCPETEIQTNNSQACSRFCIFLLLFHFLHFSLETEIQTNTSQGILILFSLLRYRYKSTISKQSTLL